MLILQTGGSGKDPNRMDLGGRSTVPCSVAGNSWLDLAECRQGDHYGDEGIGVALHSNLGAKPGRA